MRQPRKGHSDYRTRKETTKPYTSGVPVLEEIAINGKWRYEQVAPDGAFECLAFDSICRPPLTGLPTSVRLSLIRYFELEDVFRDWLAGLTIADGLCVDLQQFAMLRLTRRKAELDANWSLYGEKELTGRRTIAVSTLLRNQRPCP
jgi:hypothetical protein